MIEYLGPPEIMVGLESLAMVAFAMAFSINVRKEIGRRDHWTCQSCGKEFRDGFMVHASHLPEHHSKDDPLYDTPDAGEILCIECHKMVHQQGTSIGPVKDAYAVRLLSETPVMTREWYQKHGGE